MTIAEMNKADMQVIELVNAATDRKCEEEMRRQEARRAEAARWAEVRREVDLLQAEEDKQSRKKLNRRILIASGSVGCFLASMASVAAMELGRLTPTVGIVFMVVPALVAARMMIRDAGR